MVDPKIVEAVQKYLTRIREIGIAPASAVLYGSAARGDMHQWSDIDVIVLSPIFDKQYDHQTLGELWHATVIDSRIHPIACGAKQWQTDDYTPIFEIARREGILIEAA